MENQELWKAYRFVLAQMQEARTLARRMKRERDEARAQLAAANAEIETWRTAHDNLAQQLSTTNDSLEVAVDALMEIERMIDTAMKKLTDGCDNTKQRDGKG